MNDIVIVQDKPLSAGEIQAQVNVIQHCMKQVMKKDVHYGVIPGCKEPSLYKPGAEKIMATFRLAADPEVEDLSNEDIIRYRVKVYLKTISGMFVGAGIGECSSNEEKYKWRRAVCDEEFEDTPVNRRRVKWSKGWNGKPPTSQQQVRTEPSDLANTVLKMAKKRALIDAVLTATAASDIFTQDIEDLPPEYINEETGEVTQKKPQPKASAPRGTAQAENGGSGKASEGQLKMIRKKLEAMGYEEAVLEEVMGKKVADFTIEDGNAALAKIQEGF